MERCGRPARWVTLDVIVLLLLSLAMEMVYFSAQQGRAVISADSIQYVAGADALLNGDSVPHFEMRKPGYILWLWLVGLVAGNLGWAAIVANHVLLVSLPAGAYGMGLMLHSRALAWVAAWLTIARLGREQWANRMMSEALYAVLLTFGLLAVCMALKRQRSGQRAGSFDVCWLVAGTLLGLAWLTRGTAAAVIAAVVALMMGMAVWEFVQTKCGSLERTLQIAAFLAPVLVLCWFECTLNEATTGRLATSTATRGAALLLRMTYYQGEELPETPEARRALEWIPERKPGDAFVVSDIDVWIARHRALHVDGLNEWEYDALMGKIGAELVRRDPIRYAVSAGGMAFSHLVRFISPYDLAGAAGKEKRHDMDINLKMAGFAGSPDVSCVPGDYEGPPCTEGPVGLWWSLPEWPKEKRNAFINEVTTAARTKAPFGDGRIWANARYWLSLEPVHALMQLATSVCIFMSSFGLILGLVWGRFRPGFALLALVVLAEAALIGALVMTSERFMFVWIAMDSVRAGMVIVIAASLAWNMARPLILEKYEQAMKWSVATWVRH